MAFPVPAHSNGQINRAGSTLIDRDSFSSSQVLNSLKCLNHWRSCHGYPINTFQATLRNKIAAVGCQDTIVAQRLKRLPSILAKLNRYPTMNLCQMQDIGGIRAVVPTLDDLRKLEAHYKKSGFDHVLTNEKDYIVQPKSDGYRGLHLVYRYKSRRRKEYDGLSVEVQIRTKLQHIWATAVETMGTYLDYALKSSEGPSQWLDFFGISGSMFAHIEGTPTIQKHGHLAAAEVEAVTLSAARKLDVRAKLRAFAAATKTIEIHELLDGIVLVVLDPVKKLVELRSFAEGDLDTATQEYNEIEEKISLGASLQAVLVRTDRIADLKRAYPNYFLDAAEFNETLDSIESSRSDT